MTDYLKPNKVQNIWASAGDRTPPPDDAKIATGWEVEIPSLEDFNYLEHKQDSMLAHINQKGIPEWDTTTDYLAGRSYCIGSNGLVYRSKTNHSGVNPVTDVTFVNWEFPFYYRGDVFTKAEVQTGYMYKSANLSDLTNTATARSNLSVLSSAQTAATYLSKAASLTDVPDVNAARLALSVPSITYVGATFADRSANLTDLSSAATAFNHIKQQATESSSGVLEVATDAEMSTTDDTKAATPRKLRWGLDVSLGANGHIKFPTWLGNGLIFCWGSDEVFSNSNGYANLSIGSFPTVCLQAVCGLGLYGSPTDDQNPPFCEPVGTGLVLYNPDNDHTSRIRYFAIGY